MVVIKALTGKGGVLESNSCIFAVLIFSFVYGNIEHKLACAGFSFVDSLYSSAVLCTVN